LRINEAVDRMAQMKMEYREGGEMGNAGPNRVVAFASLAFYWPNGCARGMRQLIRIRRVKIGHWEEW
jgi:hypothetical protein